MRGLRQAGQTVPRDKRAGMITTRWFTTVNTMFTPIPRTTAAAAYRQYLGLDLARMQGLHPAVSEPADYDSKGVAAPACAVCHSTLDPLTYPFTRYDGIIRNNYNPNRLKNFVRTDGARVVEAPEAGEIFGQKVANLLEWSQVAANSDAFAQKVVWDYWKLMVGREPGPADQTEFTARLAADSARPWSRRICTNRNVPKATAATIQASMYAGPGDATHPLSMPQCTRLATPKITPPATR
jgi:hypothetical protein